MKNLLKNGGANIIKEHTKKETPLLLRPIGFARGPAQITYNVAMKTNSGLYLLQTWMVT